MDQSQIKVFQMITGQTIISKYTAEQDSYILIKPLSLETSSFDGVLLTPVNSSELMEDQVKVFKNGIVSIGTPTEFLIDKYVSLTSREEKVKNVTVELK